MQSSVADSDPYVFGPTGFGSGSVSQRYGSVSFYPQAKILRKTLNKLFFMTLSKKFFVNVPSKSTVGSK